MIDPFFSFGTTAFPPKAVQHLLRICELHGVVHSHLGHERTRGERRLVERQVQTALGLLDQVRQISLGDVAASVLIGRGVTRQVRDSLQSPPRTVARLPVPARREGEFGDSSPHRATEQSQEATSAVDCRCGATLHGVCIHSRLDLLFPFFGLCCTRAIPVCVDDEWWSPTRLADAEKSGTEVARRR